MDRYLTRALELEDDIITWRRYIHEHAETGDEVPMTAAYIKSRLDEFGIAYTEPWRGGVVAELGRGGGKTLLLRADTDALPHTEQSGEPFACKTGASHSCGHDIHTASLLGAARILKENESELEGTVRLCFQPDEERIFGAEAMIKAGVMNGVDAAVGYHVNIPLPAGDFNVRPGGYLASSDIFEIKVSGAAAHGSMPEIGVDALLAGVKIVDAVQGITTREINALTPVVITFGSFNAGQAANVMPGEATLSGTIRAFLPETREFARRRLEEVAAKTAEAHRATAEVKWLSCTPPVFNDPQLTQDITKWLGEAVGPQHVHARDLMLKASDDFAYYGELGVPAVMYHIGAGMLEDGFGPGLHNPRCRFDERTLAPAAAGAAVVAREYLRQK